LKSRIQNKYKIILQMGAKKSHYSNKELYLKPEENEANQITLDRALVEAVNNGNYDTIQTHLDAGANPRIVLYLAAITKEFKIFELLYQHTEDPDNYGLLRSLNENFNCGYDDQTIQRLFSVCIYIIKQNETRRPLLYQSLMKHACKYDNLDVLTICYERGCDLYLEDGILLFIAVENNHKRIIECLIRTNILDNFSRFSFGKLLKAAIKSSNQEIIDVCLKKLM
jgi:ankyrin repeat protein